MWCLFPYVDMLWSKHYDTLHHTERSKQITERIARDKNGDMY